jgi:hypothetical protein
LELLACYGLSGFLSYGKLAWRNFAVLCNFALYKSVCVCTIHCIYLNIVNCLVHSNFKYVQRGWECRELCIHFPTYLHGNFTFT